MKQRSVVKKSLLLFALFISLFQALLYADPTEIYLSGSAQGDAANVLFVLDNSGSMRIRVTGSGDAGADDKIRMKVMQDALKAALDKASSNLNVGLMRFGGNQITYDLNGETSFYTGANGVAFPISPIDAEAYKIVGAFQTNDNLPNVTAGVAVRDYLSTITSSWVEFSNTPIVPSLYEAALYFRGMTPESGFLPPNELRAAHPSTYLGAIGVCALDDGTAFCLDERGGCPTSTEKPSLDCPPELSNVSLSGGPGKVCKYHTCRLGSGTAAYKSPITQVCQKNFIVLMTDGAPANAINQSTGLPYPDSTKDKIQTLLGGKSCQNLTSFDGAGTCGPELTSYLATNDQSLSIPDKQTIETFTIGFGIENDKQEDFPKTAPEDLATRQQKLDYLRSLASPGGGFFEADNGDELTAAFQTIIKEAEKQSLSVTSPAYTLNASNNLAHSDEIFIPVFDSSIKPLWSGNLRKFKLVDGKIMGLGAGGSNYVSAMSEDVAGNSTGQFESTAQDLWSSKPSGNDVTQGGAAALLDPAKRKLFFDLDNTLVKLEPANVDPTWLERTRMALSSLNVGGSFGLGINASTTVSNLGSVNGVNGLWWYDCDGVYHTDMPTGGYNALQELLKCKITVTPTMRDNYIKFAQGYEKAADGTVTETPRHHMGDILHSKPVVYDYLNDKGRVIKRTIFVGTNEGYLHAFDADTGVERWAFMPKDLLKNIGIFFDNTETLKHVYGVDGQIRVWVNDVNKNGKIDTNYTAPEDKEGVYLIFSLGRGGGYYYALNITNPDNPELAWKIYPNKDSKFTELGETWSKPALGYLRQLRKSDNKPYYAPVLVFGAGYDPVKDEKDPTKRLADTKGRDIYIVNASTGELIWSLKASIGTNSALTHSIPSGIRVLDMNHDGSLDRLYFADTGGNVWRVDLDFSDATNTITSSLTQLADLGGTGTGGRRMFFSEPDVAMQLSKGKPILTVALGSGYRMHPLSVDIQDRFYVFKDEYVYENRPNDAPVLKEDVDILSTAALEPNSILESNYKGWYMPLTFNGEKVLSPALTFMGKIIFTSFALADENGVASSSSTCEKTITTSRVYVLDLLNGQAVVDLNRDKSGKDKFKVVSGGDLLDTPQVFFKTPTTAEGQACVQGNCQQVIEIRVGKLTLPLLDKNNVTNSSLLDSVDLSKIVPRLYWLNKDVSPDQ